MTSLSYLPVSLRLEGFVCFIYVSCLKKFSYHGPIKYSPMIFSKRVIISTFSFMRLRNMKLIFLLVVLEKDLIFFKKTTFQFTAMTAISDMYLGFLFCFSAQLF